jgi:tRNA(Leu) C34 or U34 (ribose-2'-O)-methylase TrmL
MTDKNNMFFGVGLDNTKNDINIGSALRATGIYGGAFLAVTKQRYKKACTDTMSFYKNIPLFRVNNLHDIIPYNCIPIAIEITENAIPLYNYKHPGRAFYIFGAEDNTLGKRVLEWCKDVVYIPTNGCMNLASCVNVVLYDRLSKLNNL